MQGNIYKTAREMTAFTQEAVAECLHISVDSIRAYETDKRRPADEIVLSMIRLYDYPYLGYQHLMTSPLKDLLPKVLPYTMQQASMRLVRLIDKFEHDRQDNKLLEIAEDGIVSDDEVQDYRDIIHDLDEIVQAVLALDLKNPIMQTHNQTSKKDIKF